MRSPYDTEEKQAARALRIHWARKIVEPNRMEFARKMGIDVTTVRDIESGRRNPGIELLYAICHRLRISLDYIVKGSLHGVDPLLAVELVKDHPELAQRQSNHDNDRMGNPANTFPRARAAFLQS